VLYYKSRRSDLDPSVLLDSLQGIVYKNDRQVREMHISFDVDKHNPRAVIVLEEMEDHDD
jgi:Holliday junction resolvase RusA-like endonuclease